MSEEISDQDLKPIEIALASLVPAPPRIDRDQLFFRAGQASARQKGLFWPWTSGILGLVAASLALVMIFRPKPEPVIRIVAVPKEIRPGPMKTNPQDQGQLAASFVGDRETHRPMQSKNAALQDQLIRWGLDGLASPPVAANARPPLTMENLLNSAPAKPDNPGRFLLKDSFKSGGKL